MKTLAAAALVSALFASTALADVTTRDVTFTHEGVTMSGTLYLPSGYQAGAKLPTVVVTGAWTSVKEQMPKEYAEEMAERGFAAFTFDFRGWGASGDLPNTVRFKEDPQAKIADIKAAVEFVATLPEVDAARISGLGICASAGYMVDAASGNATLQSVALVAPWLQNETIVNAVYGGADGVKGLIGLSKAAEATPGGVIIPAAGPEGAEGVLMPIGGYYYEPSRGAIPQYDNKWNNLSWEAWLTYFPVDNAAKLDKPLKIVHSEAAAIPDGVRAYLAGYTGTDKVTWLDNVTQFDFYDQEAAVDAASDAVVEHFADTNS